MPELKNITSNPPASVAGGLLHTFVGLQISHIVSLFGKPDDSDCEAMIYFFEIKGDIFYLYQRSSHDRNQWSIGGRKGMDYTELTKALESLKSNLSKIERLDDHELLTRLEVAMENKDKELDPDMIGKIKEEICTRWINNLTYYE